MGRKEEKKTNRIYLLQQKLKRLDLIWSKPYRTPTLAFPYITFHQSVPIYPPSNKYPAHKPSRKKKQDQGASQKLIAINT
jgi:hypothetical protein